MQTASLTAVFGDAFYCGEMKIFTTRRIYRDRYALVAKIMVMILAAEFFIMLAKDAVLKPLLLPYELPYLAWDILDAFTLTVLLGPALLWLVVRPLQIQQRKLEQQNAELARLNVHVVEEENKFEVEHRRVLEARERMLQIEKLTALGTMVGGVAHEINNPLMGVINYVEYAQEKATDPKSKEVLQDALHEIDRIKKVVSNMLVFVHPGGTGEPGSSAAVAVKRTLDLFQGEIGKNQLHIAVQLPDGLPPLAINEGSLQQVLLNLLLNARDAVAGQADKRITISGGQTEGLITLSVCDNGQGVPAEIRNKIFDLFYTTKPVGQGTGLGLSISRRLVEEAGGRLELMAQGEQGYASCFRISCAPAATKNT